MQATTAVRMGTGMDFLAMVQSGTAIYRRFGVFPEVRWAMVADAWRDGEKVHYRLTNPFTQRVQELMASVEGLIEWREGV